jgi:uncharacterized membrane protein YkoI
MNSTLRVISLALALTLLPDTLLAADRVSRGRAETTALQLVPGGAIVSGGLEKDKGNKLVWAFDVSIPGSRNVKAIAIDAYTGMVLSNTLEAPEDR